MIFHKKKNQDDIIMLLGPGCSDVSSSVAEVASHWNLTVVKLSRIRPKIDLYLNFFLKKAFIWFKFTSFVKPKQI